MNVDLPRVLSKKEQRQLTKHISKAIEKVIGRESESDNETKEKEIKKKRVTDPSKMTFIKALGIYKQQTGHKGISPKKGSAEYDAIMKIMKAD